MSKFLTVVSAFCLLITSVGALANPISITCRSEWVYENRAPVVYNVVIDEKASIKMRIYKKNFASEETKLFWGDFLALEEMPNGAVGYANVKTSENDEADFGVFFKKQDFETRSDFRAKVKNIQKYYDVSCTRH